MNRQVNPDHCYPVDDDMYQLMPMPGTPQWAVLKNGRHRQTFTSLTAAKGWLEYVLDHPESDRAVQMCASCHGKVHRLDAR